MILCGAALVTVLWLGIERTRFGARVRASVDNLRMAQSVGIDTSRLFMTTFALGTGLAGLGGGLGAYLLAINPSYALQNLAYFLIVVAVGGLGSIRGPFVASLLLGIAVFTLFQLTALLIVVSLLFSAMVQERWREVGLLRAMGAKPNQIMTVILGEAAIIRNIGGRITPATLQTMAMLGLIPQVEGVPVSGGFHLIVLHHTDCGITRLVGFPDLLAQHFGVAPDDLAAKAVTDPHRVRNKKHA